jgi:hypothetical protein
MKTKELKTIFDRAGRWPKDAQDELFRSAAEIESRYANIYHLNDDERVALRRSDDDVRNNRFASDDEVDTVLGRFLRA